eukprot:768718-Hanusia_phi.AAC.3
MTAMMCYGDCTRPVRSSEPSLFWRGEVDVTGQGKRLLAVLVYVDEERCFKLRAKKRAGGRVGGLAELAYFLSLNNMSTEGT